MNIWFYWIFLKRYLRANEFQFHILSRKVESRWNCHPSYNNFINIIISRNFAITKLQQAKLEFNFELDAPLLQVGPVSSEWVHLVFVLTLYLGYFRQHLEDVVSSGEVEIPDLSTTGSQYAEETIARWHKNYILTSLLSAIWWDHYAHNISSQDSLEKCWRWHFLFSASQKAT